jgi:hypothetical protein
MASHHAGAAVFGFGVLDRIGPPAERNFLAYMLGLRTGVGAVAGRTGAPLLAVDVEKMEIVFAVAEIGQLGGYLFWAISLL